MGGCRWLRSKWDAAEGDQLPSSSYMEYMVTIVVSVEVRSLSVAAGASSGRDESEEVVSVESGDGCELAAGVGGKSFNDGASMNPFAGEGTVVVDKQGVIGSRKKRMKLAKERQSHVAVAYDLARKSWWPTADNKRG